MARIDAIIEDELHKKFRMEIAKRLGVKKGNLSIALEEAMELWIKNDVVQKLKQRLLDGATLTEEESQNLVNALKKQGKPAMPALLELQGEIDDPRISKYVSKAISDVPTR